MLTQVRQALVDPVSIGNALLGDGLDLVNQSVSHHGLNGVQPGIVSEYLHFVAGRQSQQAL